MAGPVVYRITEDPAHCARCAGRIAAIGRYRHGCLPRLPFPAAVHGLDNRFRFRAPRVLAGSRQRWEAKAPVAQLCAVPAVTMSVDVMLPALFAGGRHDALLWRRK